MTDRQRLLGLLALVCAVGLAVLETTQDPRSRSDDARGTLLVEIGDDGALTFEQGGGGSTLGRLDAADAGASADAIDALRSELRARTWRPALRDERGHSILVLRILTGPTVPWAYVHWVVRVAGDPIVELVHLRFALRGDAAAEIAWERPTGQSCCPGPYVQTTSPFVRLVVGRESDANHALAAEAVLVWFGSQTTSSYGQGAERIDAETVTERATLGSLRDFQLWWERHREAMRGGTAEVSVRGTSRSPVPSGDVVAVWRALLRAEVRRLHYVAGFEPPRVQPR